MKDNNEKLIETKTLENGVKMSLFDFCRPVAGDRWYVKILCRLELALPQEKIAESGLSDANQAAFGDHYDGILAHEFTRERNFVDEMVKDEVVRFIISQLHENTMSYVANPVFADNLFKQKIEEFLQQQDIRRQMALCKDDEDDDGGPVDFSSCFQD